MIYFAAILTESGESVSCMAPSKQPVRLESDPIVEAIFEMHFASESTTLADLLPGLLYPHFKGRFPKMERLPISDIPRDLQSTEPNLKYQPRQRMVGQHFSILLGDYAVAISAPRPYAGWTAFRALAIELLEQLQKTELIKNVERFSFKYINLLEASDIQSQYKLVNFNANLGGKELTECLTQLRAEFHHHGFTNIIEVAANAAVKTASGEKLNGLFLSIDIISLTPDDFFVKAEEHLEAAHKLEKEIFYSILTPAAVNSFKPIWDQ